MTQNLGNRVQRVDLPHQCVSGWQLNVSGTVIASVACQNAGKPLVRWPSREDTPRSVALADHGAPLTVITLSRGSRSMWTSKTKGLAKWKAREVQLRSLRQSGCRVQLRPSDYRGQRLPQRYPHCIAAAVQGGLFLATRQISGIITFRSISFGALNERDRQGQLDNVQVTMPRRGRSRRPTA